jgi:putative DNA primase/helicase
MTDRKYSRKEVLAILNPAGTVPKQLPNSKLNQCLYCSNYADVTYGANVACYAHADEKWKEHDRKPSRASKMGTADGKAAASASKRRTMQSAMKEQRDEEQFNGLCRGGCGKMISGEYTCYDCRMKAKAKSYALMSGEIELWRGDVKDSEGKLTRQIVAVSADTIQPERMGWVWRDRIPDEAISWILGQPNNAKSLLTIEIAACATTGRQWPDGTENTMGAVDVLMLCFEDSLSKQVVPRLIAAGADLTRIKFLDRKSFRTHLDGDPEPAKKGLDLSEHLPILLDIMKANPQFKLIIVDPIRDIFGKARMTHDNEVGPVLADLIEFCEKAHVAFVGVVHVPKHQNNSAVEKIAGGSAVAASAKSAFMLSRDPDSDDKHHHVMTMVKWNYTGKTGGIKYSTVPATVDHKGVQIEIAKIEWGETTDIIADDVLKAQNAKPMERDRQADKCEAFLMTFLKSGPRRSPDVYDTAKQLGFGDTTVKRALKAIGGYHLDRRAQRAGFWMSLEPNPSFSSLDSEATMSLAAGEAL